MEFENRDERSDLCSLERASVESAAVVLEDGADGLPPQGLKLPQFLHRTLSCTSVDRPLAKSVADSLQHRNENYLAIR